MLFHKPETSEYALLSCFIRLDIKCAGEEASNVIHGAREANPWKTLQTLWVKMLFYGQGNDMHRHVFWMYGPVFNVKNEPRRQDWRKKLVRRLLQ